jgi:hypothetical protein
MILSLCDLTGNMIRPWLDAGYDCAIVDLQHPAGYHRDGKLWRVGMDIMKFYPPSDVEMCFAFPPCTHLSGSGARWWNAKGLPALIEALTLVNRCLEITAETGAPWFIENPVGRLSTLWRNPDYTFDPCDYGGYLDPAGDKYTKKTCLWTGGGFVMPSKKYVYPAEGSKMWFIPPGEERSNLRSETPMGFARAVFEANRNGARQMTMDEMEAI